MIKIKLNIIIIGLGKQSIEDHIPALISSNRFNIYGVFDLDKSKSEKIANELHSICIEDLSIFIKENKSYIDLALISVTHNAYFELIKILSENKIDIIKEKPFALSIREAISIFNLVNVNNIFLGLTLQRRFNPIFNLIKENINNIGRIYISEFKYVMDIKELDKGWRANKKYAGGGALIDLGYHYIDLIIWLFGLPEYVFCQTSLNNREGQNYDVEDTVLFTFLSRTKSTKSPMLGNCIISRVYDKKDEYIKILGTEGNICLKDGVLYINNNLKDIKMTYKIPEKKEVLKNQVDFFYNKIVNQENKGCINIDYLMHIALIEACYLSSSENRIVKPNLYLNKISIEDNIYYE